MSLWATPISSRRSPQASSSARSATPKAMWSRPVLRSSNRPPVPGVGCPCRPNSRSPRANTVWWNVPVSSSSTGSLPSRVLYQGTLTLRSLTVIATCVMCGKSAICAPLCLVGGTRCCWQRLRPGDGLAVKDDAPVLVGDRGPQGGHGLVFAQADDLDFCGDLVAWLHGGEEAPVGVKEDRAGAGELLGDDRVEESGGHASLYDHAAEPGRGRDLLVVVQRVAVARELGEQLDVPHRDGTGPAGGIADTHGASWVARLGTAPLSAEGGPGSWRQGGDAVKGPFTLFGGSVTPPPVRRVVRWMHGAGNHRSSS